MTFRIRLDEIQDPLLPPRKHWVGPITGPPSASHPCITSAGKLTLALNMINRDLLEYNSDYPCIGRE